MAKKGRPKGSKTKLSIVPRAKKKAPKPDGQAPLSAERDMPDAEGALAALRTLADMNDRLKRLEAIEEDAKNEYHVAKSDRETQQKSLADQLWKLTHKPNLPLFNERQAEADLQQIQEAAAAPASATVLEGGQEAAPVPPLELPDAEAQEEAPF